MLTPNDSPQASPEQEEIIIASPVRGTPYRWDLVLACPGAGKTFTLVERIKWLADRYDPGKFVVITFTNAAARELRARLPEGLKPKFVGTLHAWILTILRQEFKSSIHVIDELEQTEILGEIMESQAFKGGATKALHIYRKMIADNEHSFADTSAAGLVAKEYYQRTLARGVMDYDSILTVGLAYIRITKIKERLGREVDFLFVDEFQDTSRQDYEIYKQLRQVVPYHFYVGDPDQAIYSFRGSDHTGILQLANEVSGFNVHKLTHNFRCPHVVGVNASHLIDHNKARVPKDMICDNRGGTVWVDEFQTIGQEVEAMIHGICGNMAAGRLNTQAVLVRTNALVDLYSGMLGAWNIPILNVQKAGQQSPELAKAIKAILWLSCPDNDDFMKAWLRASQDPEFVKSISLSAMRQFKSINQISGNVKAVGLETRLWHELYALDIPTHAVVQIQRIAAGLQPGDSIPELILAIKEEQETVTVPTEPGVAVITMHSAKGLEFDHVYLPAFEQHIFPGKKVGEFLEEERRLAFVALTRARESVHITHISERRDTYRVSEMIKARPSQFISEMGFSVDR